MDTIQGILDDPGRRLRRLKALRDIRMEASLKEMKNIWKIRMFIMRQSLGVG